MTKATKLATLCQWTQQQSARGETVIILSHFPSSFLENQDALQDAGIDFEIIAERMDEPSFAQWLESSSGRGEVLLTMAQMLALSPGDFTPASSQPNLPSSDKLLSVIVTERYPIVINDQHLEAFFRRVDRVVSMGYLISFDDPLVKGLLGERFVNLMEQLGFSDNELISSAMTYRGLARKLQKSTASVTQEQTAESPEEWIELNGIPGVAKRPPAAKRPKKPS
ncbi:MAG: hypothetical protein P8J33_04190 [Pirellulaceae bacterium]|nr:hypothetical protein [Pirellulaceae bacterium]